MSVIETSSIKNSAGVISYLFYGRKAQVTENYRARAVFCSTSLQVLKVKADVLQKTKRVAPLISIIQSFSNEQDSLNPNSKKDCRYVNSLGVALANKLYPASDCLVVTHNDGTNHNLHNHIIILNYDYRLKHTLRKNRSLYKMRYVNDTLMREHGLSVVKKNKKLEKTTFETKRIRKEDPNWDKHDFDTILKNKIKLAKKTAKDFAGFVDFLGKSGVEVKTRTSKKNSAVGLTFKMLDRFHYKKVADKKVLAPRPRRRKSSKLGSSFSYEAILRACEANEKALEKTKQEQEKRRLALIKQAQQAKKRKEQETELRPSKHYNVTVTHFNVSKYGKHKPKKDRSFSKKKDFTTYHSIVDPALAENNEKEAQKRIDLS